MADTAQDPDDGPAAADTAKDPLVTSAESIQQENAYHFSDSRKLGITGATFLIINKMIGTGVFSTPSGIFVDTGSVGISIILWVIGM